MERHLNPRLICSSFLFLPYVNMLLPSKKEKDWKTNGPIRCDRFWSVLLVAALVGYIYGYFWGGWDWKTKIVDIKNSTSYFGCKVLVLKLEYLIWRNCTWFVLFFITAWQHPEYLLVLLKVVKQICRLQVHL